MGEDRIGRLHRVDAVEAHDLRAEEVRGEVGVRDDHLVAVAEAAQGMEQVGAEHGVDVSQHGSPDQMLVQPPSIEID